MPDGSWNALVCSMETEARNALVCSMETEARNALVCSMETEARNALVCSMETARASMPDGSCVDVPDGSLNWRLDVLICPVEDWTRVDMSDGRLELC